MVFEDDEEVASGEAVGSRGLREMPGVLLFGGSERREAGWRERVDGSPSVWNQLPLI